MPVNQPSSSGYSRPQDGPPPSYSSQPQPSMGAQHQHQHQYGTFPFPAPHETTPFYVVNVKDRPQWSFYTLLLLAAVTFLVGNITQLPINTALHDLQAGDWAREERQWTLKKEEHEREVDGHNTERARMGIERKSWNEERNAENIRKENERKAWNEERNAEMRRRENERKAWEEERRCKEDEARQEREEHERKHSQIHWTGLAPLPACSRYKIREYTASLTDVPLGFDAIAECMSKPAYINGRDVLPYHCEDQGNCGKATGRWEVEEGYCMPYHSVIEDHGCYRPGGHQYKGKVEDIQDWINWEGICMTMPGPFYNGVELGLPYYCSPAAGGRKGYWPNGCFQIPTATETELNRTVSFSS